MVLRIPQEIQKKSSKTQHFDSMYGFKEIQKNSKEIQQNKKSRPNVCLTNPEEIHKKSSKKSTRNPEEIQLHPESSAELFPIMLILDRKRNGYTPGKTGIPHGPPQASASRIHSRSCAPVRPRSRSLRFGKEQTTYTNYALQTSFSSLSFLV